MISLKHCKTFFKFIVQSQTTDTSVLDFEHGDLLKIGHYRELLESIWKSNWTGFEYIKTCWEFQGPMDCVHINVLVFQDTHVGIDRDWFWL